MTTIELGECVRLSRVGDFGRAGDDPAMTPPVDIVGRFPKAAANFRCGPEGTWYATVEELAKVVEAGKTVKRPRHRIHWLDRDRVIRRAEGLPVFHEAAFADDVALLSGDRGTLYELSLDSGRVVEVAIEGWAFGDRARLWEIYFLNDHRVVIHADDELIIATRTDKGLAFRARVPFEGAIAVLGGRFLVGGTDSIRAIDLATDEAVEAGSSTRIGVGSFWYVPGRLRTYSQEDGAWEISLF